MFVLVLPCCFTLVTWLNFQHWLNIWLLTCNDSIQVRNIGGVGLSVCLDNLEREDMDHNEYILGLYSCDHAPLRNEVRCSRLVWRSETLHSKLSYPHNCSYFKLMMLLECKDIGKWYYSHYTWKFLYSVALHFSSNSLFGVLYFYFTLGTTFFFISDCKLSRVSLSFL